MKELEITHLMFADDVMVFFDGSSSSLHGIIEALEDFASWSGLRVNMEKSQLFLAGKSQRDIEVMEQYGFPVGSLPIRYLGLPLMTRKLRLAEYEPLLEKIEKRLSGWSVKCLSYAGRVQLIASVISSTVNFWTSTFLLPKGCLRRIESLCSRFLWSNSMEVRKEAKVAWEDVCRPRAEGGVGLKRFRDSNKTLCLKLLWTLFKETGSIWAKWHKLHHLKDKSLWEVKDAAWLSWNWRSLLQLRPLAERFLRCSLGNGQRASFWHDHWSPLGPLIKLMGFQGPSIFGIPSSVKVANACNHERWLLPLPRAGNALILHAHLNTIHLPLDPSKQDTYTWRVKGLETTVFTASTTWEELRTKRPEQPWAKLIWYKGAVPKQAFHMWITHLDRLPTKQRLASWGHISSATCSLCASNIETRDHVFLTCLTTAMVWKWTFFRLCPTQVLFTSWTELLTWMRGSTLKTPALIRRLAAYTIIYHIWRQRNNAIHNHMASPTDTFRLIDRDIRNTISAKRHKRRWRCFMTRWIR